MPNPEKNIYIDGFALAGYRSFGSEVQYLGPCSKINIIIGQNNCGKSNIIRFLLDRFKVMFHRNNQKELSIKEIPLRSNHEYITGICKPVDQFTSKISNDNAKEIFLDVFTKFSLLRDGLLWLTVKFNGYPAVSIQDLLSIQIDHWKLSRLCENLGLNRGFHLDDKDTIGEILQKYQSLMSQDMYDNTIFKIESHRNVVKNSVYDTTDDNDGSILINNLAKYQDPAFDLENENNANNFILINSFLKDILQDDSARIRIPYDKKTIHVVINKKELPLESLGTGIEQAIVLASKCTIIDKSVICIEEPEIQMHPTLQKKVLRYLRDKTGNQYFITTHSAHIIDIEDVSVFGVSLKDNVSCIRNVSSESNKWNVVYDLGYRASDIVQSNCIIWVEGPSDRIYLNHWIYLKDNKLKEGSHYSIMFYGGKLLSHLSASDEEIGDLISLIKMNRNSFIVMDSDKTSSNMKVDKHKIRIKKEIKPNVWITSGREIENYIDNKTLEISFMEIAQKFKYNNTSYNNAYRDVFVPKGGKKSRPGLKVKLAKKVVETQNLEDAFTTLDLESNICKVIQFIRKANEI